MKRIILFLCILLGLGCAGSGSNFKKFNKNYNKLMIQADELAEVLCEHSEFSVCYWRSALGEDIKKLPVEALECLDRIDQIVRGKTVDELSECEKAEVLGLWQRFAGLVTKELIEQVTPYMVKFIGML